MRSEKSFKFYSNNQWLLRREQTWFNMADILNALIFKYKLINGWIDNKLNCLIYLILLNYNYNLYLGQYIRNLIGHTH
jgi:hypothetical protein